MIVRIWYAWRSGSQASMSYGGGMTPGHMPGQGQMQSQSM